MSKIAGGPTKQRRCALIEGSGRTGGPTAMKRPRSLSKSFATCLLLWASLMLCSGCVGLNIPSVRYHEPPTPPGAPRTLDEALLFSRDPALGPGPAGQGMVGGGACPTGDCGPELEEPPAGPAPKLPAVPWPRFHPVPTTPVFGG